MTEDRESAVVEAVPTGLFIGGKWRDGTGGARLSVEDPATGQSLCEVADATADDAVAALDSAVAAQESWAATPPRERGEILRRTFQLMNERVDDLALLLTLEMGKPIAESKGEVSYAAEFFRWFAEEAARSAGRGSVNPARGARGSGTPAGAGRLLPMKHPVGPCLLITPWSFPIAMGPPRLGPATAAG